MAKHHPGAKIGAIVADISTPEGVDTLFARADSFLGGVDIVVNNAAAVLDPRSPLADVAEPDEVTHPPTLMPGAPGAELPLSRNRADLRGCGDQSDGVDAGGPRGRSTDAVPAPGRCDLHGGRGRISWQSDPQEHPLWQHQVCDRALEQVRSPELLGCLPLGREAVAAPAGADVPVPLAEGAMAWGCTAWVHRLPDRACPIIAPGPSPRRSKGAWSGSTASARALLQQTCSPAVSRAPIGTVDRSSASRRSRSSTGWQTMPRPSPVGSHPGAMRASCLGPAAVSLTDECPQDPGNAPQAAGGQAGKPSVPDDGQRHLAPSLLGKEASGLLL